MRPRAGRRSVWAIALGGSRADRLAVARDVTSTSGDLAAVAPGYQDRSPDVELIAAVLEHPAVTEGIVSRYATCVDEAIRLRVAAHPRCPSTALDVLAVDPSAAVRQVVRDRLE